MVICEVQARVFIERLDCSRTLWLCTVARRYSSTPVRDLDVRLTSTRAVGWAQIADVPR